jgi:hypothetical protein
MRAMLDLAFNDRSPGMQSGLFKDKDFTNEQAEAMEAFFLESFHFPSMLNFTGARHGHTQTHTEAYAHTAAHACVCRRHSITRCLWAAAVHRTDAHTERTLVSLSLSHTHTLTHRHCGGVLGLV